MAAAITTATGVPVDLVSGDRGEFSVWVGDRVVSKKTIDGFPEPAEAVIAVQAALG